MKILFILGPNLNMVGIRDRATYGTETAESINDDVMRFAEELNIELEIYQSNHEGDIIDKLHAAYGNTDGIMINAGAHSLQLCSCGCYILSPYPDC